MIVYKVVRYNGNTLLSAAPYNLPKSFIIEYKIGKWITKKCFAFSTLENANYFRESRAFSCLYAIYKAETKNCISLPRCFNFLQICDYKIHLINLILIKDYAKFVYENGNSASPSGTILCSGIKLLEKVA